MNEEFVQQVTGMLVDAGSTALTRFAQKQVEAIQEMIGIPVERVGRQVIRSAPGEPPRKDEGILYDSIQATEAYYVNDIISLVIFTDDPKSAWLEEGTDFMAARPFWERSLVEMVQRQDELQALFAEELSANVSVGV